MGLNAPTREAEEPTRIKRVGFFLSEFVGHLMWWLLADSWGEPKPTHTKCKRPGCGARVRITETANHDLIMHRFGDVTTDIFKSR